MRQYYPPTGPEKAEAKDHAPVVEFREWGKANAQAYQNEEAYFTLIWDNYRVVYSRTSKRIQCYYLGYGYDSVEKSFYDFDSLEEIIEFIEASRDMPIIRTDVIHKVYEQTIGRTEDYDKKRIALYRTELEKAFKKYYG